MILDQDKAEDEMSIDDVDDNCFVCGQEGNLLLCDFPDCKRVYHHVCVAKIAPKPLAIDTAYDGLDATSDDTWFCPKHFCNLCGSLEKVKSSISTTMTLPRDIYNCAIEEQYRVKRQKLEVISSK